MTGLAETTHFIEWNKGETFPILEPKEVHLWWQDLSSPRLDFDALYSFLTPLEKQRVEKLKIPLHKRRYVMARGLSKWLLSRYLDCEISELQFGFGPYGKPYLRNPSEMGQLYFNYSDSAGWALYAIAWNRELGVDLESRSRRVNYRRIVQRLFTPTESKVLLGLPETQQKEAFLTCWTRKEAYGKALGVGIRYPFHIISLCDSCQDSVLKLEDHIDDQSWNLYQLQISKEFIGCLVCQEDPVELRYFSLQ